MKTFIFTLVATVLFTSSSWAADLLCHTSAPVPNPVRVFDQFKLTNIEGNEFDLESDLPDQDTLTEFELIDGQRSAVFSNECDNAYEVLFPAELFDRAVRGEAKAIRGVLHYELIGESKVDVNLICQIL